MEFNEPVLSDKDFLQSLEEFEQRRTSEETSSPSSIKRAKIIPEVETPLVTMRETNAPSAPSAPSTVKSKFDILVAYWRYVTEERRKGNNPHPKIALNKIKCQIPPTFIASMQSGEQSTFSSRIPLCSHCKNLYPVFNNFSTLSNLMPAVYCEMELWRGKYMPKNISEPIFNVFKQKYNEIKQKYESGDHSDQLLTDAATYAASIPSTPPKGYVNAQGEKIDFSFLQLKNQLSILQNNLATAPIIATDQQTLQTLLDLQAQKKNRPSKKTSERVNPVPVPAPFDVTLPPEEEELPDAPPIIPNAPLKPQKKSSVFTKQGWGEKGKMGSTSLPSTVDIKAKQRKGKPTKSFKLVRNSAEISQKFANKIQSMDASTSALV
jgi:hypothetical protein